MRVNREELLNQLESIRPGLSPREIIEQSSCVVFRNGKMMTYNDEVACTLDSSLHIEGAVQADPLIAILRKLPVDFVEAEVTDGELLIKAKSRSAGVRMEATILLPIESIETPKKWRPLHEDFAEAIGIVAQCASNDQSTFEMTCIHIHADYVEACDNLQLSRFPMATGIRQESLVRRDSIHHIIDLGMTEFSETATWLHFRNAAGLILSCRRSLEKYKELDGLLEVKGHPVSLPKGLGGAAENAEIFSAENADNNQVVIELQPRDGGRLRISGEGANGWYREVKKIKYSGDPIRFRIAPKLLVELSNRSSDCTISKERLLVNNGKFTYVTCLGVDEVRTAPKEDE